MQQVHSLRAPGSRLRALTAGLALGLVVTYRGSGIVNLAMGAVAMVAAYTFWALRTGEYGPSPRTRRVVRASRCSCRSSSAWLIGTARVPAAAHGLAAREARRVARDPADRAGGHAAHRSAPIPKSEPSILPSGTVSVFGTIVPSERFIPRGHRDRDRGRGSAALYRWTRFGLETRAAFENEDVGDAGRASPPTGSRWPTR